MRVGKPIYASTRGATDLMVLDGEENETVRVLLQERLTGLELLNGRSRLGSLDGLLDRLGDSRVDVGSRRVLLAGEVELLDGRVAHLEVLERGGSLCAIVQLASTLDFGRVAGRGDRRNLTYLLGGSDLCSHFDRSN